MLTIYKHPTDASKIVAKYRFGDKAGTEAAGEFLISSLPAGNQAARDYLIAQLSLGAPDDLVVFEVDSRDERTDTTQAFIDQAQAELTYLDATIPAIDAMTVAQVRDVVKRLAQENRAIIKALLYLAKRL